MDITPIIDKLNPAQRSAVTAPPTSMLVLAGAGSGKTRVLVHRIAWLMKVEQVYPSSILAVTFTNKASKEMRGRIEELLGRPFPIGGMWAGTFHGLAHRFLRRHAQDVGLSETFQIMDSDDQLRLVKRIVKELNMDDKRWSPRQIQWYINFQKDEGRRARHLPEASDPFERQMQRVYLMYEQQCDKFSLVDFAELLLRTYEFLDKNQEFRDHYRRRFRHVLVDEFQDTNSIQYSWLSLLTNDRDNLFVVGDDDQSIYSWRGAKIENLFKFQKDNPNHQIVKLEQNYRSTGHILSAANALIANNEGRLGKNLWTEEGLGDQISVYSAFNEQDEAYFVVDRIRQWAQEGNKRTESAILYRSNAQSRQFEEKLIAMGISYRVYGGLRFFERQEIKDALAYLRLLSNRDDPISFERVINTPTRGIGARSLDAIRELARAEDCPLWIAAEALSRGGALPARAKGLLAIFLNLVDALSAEVRDKPLHEQVKIVVEKSGLIDFYKQEKSDKGEARVENLEELVTAAKQFESEAPQQEEGENLSLLDFFLAHAALESGESQGGDSDDCVQLMTLHSAKGLEFDLVFVVGLEEGLFPSLQSLEEAGRLEEERRLCYVGITRAKKKLYLTHAESRRLYGKETYPRESRFLREIPKEHIHEIRMKANVTRPVTAKAAPISTSLSSGKAGGFRLGQRVTHVKFGEGVILHAEGEGAQARVQVNFADAGSKWLVLDFANLKAV
ncbi:MAG: DNA helicase II [Proteobacteria bacterium]|nr:DNA helicase II [Pseudomonadota bacterium]